MDELEDNELSKINSGCQSNVVIINEKRAAKTVRFLNEVYRISIH